MMDFNNMETSDTNLDKGRSLLQHLSETDITNTIALFTSDGAVDGAMYLIYRGLAESGAIESVTAVTQNEPCEQILTTVHLLKYIMYNCFIIGAEAAKSVQVLDDLWNRKETQEPD